MARGRILAIDKARGVAAVAVLICHAALTATEFASDYSVIGAGVSSVGRFGVDFFFILSGFVIAQSAADGPVNLADFASARARRVYVPYLPVAVAMMIGYTIAPQLSLAPRDWSALTSFTLLPSSREPALSVAWTLRHEVVFYVVFALAAWRRAVAAGMGLWGLLIVGAAFYDLPAWAEPVVGLRNLEFIVGVAAARLVGSRFGREAQPKPSLSSALGAASFSIYLIHEPVQSAIGRVLWGCPWTVIFGCGVVTSLLAGLAYYRAIERPLLNWSKRFGLLKLEGAREIDGARCGDRVSREFRNASAHALRIELDATVLLVHQCDQHLPRRQRQPAGGGVDGEELRAA